MDTKINYLFIVLAILCLRIVNGEHYSMATRYKGKHYETCWFHQDYDTFVKYLSWGSFEPFGTVVCSTRIDYYFPFEVCNRAYFKGFDFEFSSRFSILMVSFLVTLFLYKRRGFKFTTPPTVLRNQSGRFNTDRFHDLRHIFHAEKYVCFREVLSSLIAMGHHEHYDESCLQYNIITCDFIFDNVPYVRSLFPLRYMPSYEPWEAFDQHILYHRVVEDFGDIWSDDEESIYESELVENIGQHFYSDNERDLSSLHDELEYAFDSVNFIRYQEARYKHTRGNTVGFPTFRNPRVDSYQNQSKTWSSVAKAPRPLNVPQSVQPIVYEKLSVPQMRAKYSMKFMFRTKKRLQKIFRRNKTLDPELRSIVLDMVDVINAYCRQNKDLYSNQSRVWSDVKKFFTPTVNVGMDDQTMDGLKGLFDKMDQVLERGIDLKSSTLESIPGQINSFFSSETGVSMFHALITTIITFVTRDENNHMSEMMFQTAYGCYLVSKFGFNHPVVYFHSAFVGIRFSTFALSKVDNDEYLGKMDDYSKWSNQSLVWSEDYTSNLVKAFATFSFFLIYGKHASDATMLPFLKELSDLKKIKNGIKEGVSLLLEVIKESLNFFCDKCDSDGILIVESAVPTVDNLVKRVSDLLVRYRTTEIQYTDTEASIVFDLKKELDDMYNITLPKDPTFAEHRRILWNSIQSIKDVMTKFDSLSKSKDSTRVVPHCLCLRGPPGIGKSFSTKLILEEVLAEILPVNRLANFLKHPGNEIWSMPASDSSFSGNGYLDQCAFVIDEWLAATDGKGMDTNGLTTFLKMISDMALMLDKAQLSEKDNTFFRSNFGLLTTNRDSFFELHGIKHIEALPRRVHGVNVAVKAEYSTDATKDLGPLLRRLDKTKIPNMGVDEYGNIIPFTDCWEFQDWDFMASDHDSRLIGSPYDYRTLITRTVAKVKESQQEYSRNTSVRVHARRLAYERRRALEPTLPTYEQVMSAQSMSWEDVREYFGSVVSSVTGTPRSATEQEPVDQDVESLKKIMVMDHESYSLRLLSVKKDFLDSVNTAYGVVSGWFSRPFFRNVAIITSLVGTAAFFTSFVCSQFRTQSGEAKRAIPKVRGKKWFVSKGVIRNQSKKFSSDFELTAAKVFYKNVIKFCNAHDEDLGYILMYQKRFGLMPGHFMSEINRVLSIDPDYVVYIERMDSPLPRKFLLREMDFKDIPGQDQKLVTLPLSCMEFNDITHMIPRNTNTVYREKSIVGRITPSSSNQGSYTLIMTEADYHGSSITYDEESDTVTQNATGFYVPLRGQDGFCGLPYLGFSEDGTVYIAGFHTAGKGDSSYCSSITREMLEPLGVLTFREKKVNPYSEDKMIELACSHNFPFKTEGKSFKNTNSTFIGPAPLQNIPTKSNLVRTEFFGKFGEVTKFPGLLRSKTVIVDGQKEVIHPSMKSVKDYGKNNVVLNESLAIACTDSLISLMATKSSPPSYSGSYSFDEIVMGIEGKFPSINRATSAGFPYTRAGVTRKDIFGDGVLPDLKRPQVQVIKKEIAGMLDLCKNGQRPTVVWINNLKDEVRKLSKVLEGDTRSFMYPPVSFLIITEMYTMSAQLWLLENKISNTSAVGMNPYDIDWHAMASRHRAMGPTFSGDYSEYDKRMHPLWIQCWGRFLHWFYRDRDTEYHNVLDVIVSTLMESIHLIYDDEAGSNVFVLWMGSWLSGYFGTAQGGSFMCGVKLRYNVVACISEKEHGINHLSWTLACGYDIRELERNIVTTQQGDDHILSVSKYYASLIKPSDIQAMFHNMGEKYTDEKKAAVMGDWTDISERVFLKRYILFDETRGRYVAPRDIEDIKQSLYWRMKSCTSEEFQNVVYNTLVDISLDVPENWYLAEQIIEASATINYFPPIKTRAQFREVAFGWRAMF